MLENRLMQDLVDIMRKQYFGKYRGTVEEMDSDDPRGRLLVTIPAVLGEQAVLAMPCVPYAGNSVGFYALPPAGSGVWCEFEGGDPSYPIWVGCFWADNELPDEANQEIKIWKTEQHTLRLDDANDEILAESGSGSNVTISDSVESTTGDSKHTVDSAGVTIEGGGTGKIEVTSSSVSVNSGAFEVT